MADADRVKVLEGAARMLWYLAAGLHDDDSHYGEQRGAPSILAVTTEMIGAEALGGEAKMQQWFRDVTGVELSYALEQINKASA